MAIVRGYVITLAWTGIILAALFTLTLNLAPIEFVDPQQALASQNLRWIGVASCMAVLLLCRIRAADTGWTRALKGLTAVIAPLVFLIVFGFVGFLATSMCVWTEHETLFVHIDQPQRRIALRDHGCGATDSSRPVYRAFEVYRVNNWFNYISPIDTTAIDHSKWIRSEVSK